MNLAAYWHSLRYQHPRQWRGRARYWLTWRLLPRWARAWGARTPGACRPRPNFSWRAKPAPDLSRPHLPDDSLLGQFHRHYFDLGPTGDQIENWIAAHPPGSWPAWHPYPTSLRIVNWIGSGLSTPNLARSLAAQAAFLERNLEFHLGGNHLLENARALLAAGLYFEGRAADRWRTRGLHLLLGELEEQVLPDGGHFERSPYYHLRMTALVEDSIDLLAAAGSEIPPMLSCAAEKMEAFHRALRHADGALPLFHDGLGPSAPAPPAAAPLSFPASGYYILEGPQGRLIADYGAPASCYNPGHQHAGIFSFEISSGTRRVVVDTGTPTYEPGPERDRLRSTAAHNTVRVDGCDQFEVWSGFRVGRRAWLRDVRERRTPQCDWVSAVHDGYRRLGVEHRRTILSVPGAGWLIVDDVTGRGSHRLESFLHLGPEIAPELSSGRACLQPLGWTLLPFGLAVQPAKITDLYSPAVGRREPAETLILRAGPELPCRFGYWLGPFPAVRLTWDGAHRARLETFDGNSIELVL